MRFNHYGSVEKRKDKVLLAAAAAVFALYCAFSCTFFACGCQSIKNDVVRLHILADSDLEDAQEVKLKVRDSLLEMNTPLLSAGVSTENAAEYFENSKQTIARCAERVLKENGCDYGARVTLCREYYPTREYGDLVFPAGEYTSVKVVLGSGEGHNWWCVMFPPLCVPAADGEIGTETENLDLFMTRAGKKVITSGTKFKMKFKIAEWYEKLFCEIEKQTDALQ